LNPASTHGNILKYTNRTVSDDTLETLLKAAMAAHSADDERPWHFIVIKGQYIRDQISKIHPFAYMVTHTPETIIVCGDKALQKYRGFWIQDCAAATENILIKAKQLKLNSTWLGIYPIEGRVQHFSKLLNTPEHVIPFSLVVLGYPEEYKEPVDRFDRTRIHHDRW
jgi:nitroreductase